MGPESSSGGVKQEQEQQHQDQQQDAAVLPLHPLWREVRCGCGSSDPLNSSGGSGSSSSREGTRRFYFNPFNGRIALERFPAEPEVRGGILSDEMGLGKTVELLACITAHPYTGPPPVFADPRAHKRRRRTRVECLCGATDEDDGYTGLWLQCDACDAWMHAACVGLKRAPPGEFVCGACQRAAAAAAVTQDCGATLVVCPTPIVHQWRDEILRHIRPGALKLLVYEGQPQPGAGRTAKVVTAANLAAADIVLTTYDVLRRDINHAPDGQGAGHNLRRRKKYEVMPTPLTRLRWWRVCLDEAQMVESSTAKAAEMALKLDTVHRWCVTGTPLSRGLEDLFGLLAFLQAAPYSNRFWWHKAVQQPYEAGSRAARARLLALLKPSLGGLLWRSAKADVAHELGLPPQHHHLTRLQLSAIERHFYRRQHQVGFYKMAAVLGTHGSYPDCT
jgi:E3 ubiquitin-protein ligase SHPRH